MYLFIADHLGLNNLLGPHPWKRLVFYLSAAITCNSSSKVWLYELSTIHVGMTTGVVIVLVLLRCWNFILLRFRGCSSLSYIQDCVFHSRCPGPVALTIFHPLLLCFLSLRCSGFVIYVSVGFGNPMISCYLHIKQLWFSGMVSTAAKRRFLSEKGELYLSADRRLCI